MDEISYIGGGGWISCLVASAKEHVVLGVLTTVDALGHARHDGLVGGLDERVAKRLGAHRRGALVLLLAIVGRASRVFLDVVLALGAIAPGHQAELLVVQSRHKVLPFFDASNGLVHLGLGALKHLALHGVHGLLDTLLEVIERDGKLGARVTAHDRDLLLLQVLGADLKTKGHTAQLPVVELEARGIVIAQIRLGLDTGLLQAGRDVLAGVVDEVKIGLGRLDGQTAGDDDGLIKRDAGREDQTLVVTVDHDHDADRAGRQTPRVLPDVDLLGLIGRGGRGLGVLDRDVKHVGEVLAETVGSTALDSTARGGDEAFDGGRVQTARETLLFRLDTLDDGKREQVIVDLLIQIQNLADLLASALEGQMGRVALLPQELTRAKEGLYEKMNSKNEHAKSARGRMDLRGFLNSQRTTEHHWLIRKGRSRWERIHLAK